MKRCLLILFVVSFFAASAADADCYDFKKTIKGHTFYFSILSGDSTVAVVAPQGRQGGWKDYDKPSGRLMIPGQVQRDGEIYAVVAVDDNAFMECSQIESVTLPSSVNRLGSGAFCYCSSLRTVVIECDSIGAGFFDAFLGCTSIDSIVIAKSVHTLPPFMFSQFKTIGRVVFNAEGPRQMKNLFFGCQAEAELVIGTEVARIPDFLCYNFPGLKGIRFADGTSCLSEIGECAFVSCSGLTELVLPPGINVIGVGAFAHCQPDYLSFSSPRPPRVSPSAFLGIDKATMVEIPCASIDYYSRSSIGRCFENMVYAEGCNDSIERVKIVYVFDTIVVHDTVYVEDANRQSQRKNILPEGCKPEAVAETEIQSARVGEKLEPKGEQGDEEVEEEWLFLDGKTLRIARAKELKGVGVRVFDEKGRLIVDQRIPLNQPSDNYYIKFPRRQRYFLRFDMGTPIVVDVDRQEIKF